MLLGTACATTQMSPNRRLASGEAVFTLTGEVHPTGFFSRGGALLSMGLGVGDLEASAAMTWFGSVHLSGGARLYLGPLNLTGRAGVVREWTSLSTPAWLPAWDVRLTTVSDDAQPYYIGLHTAGFIERSEAGVPVPRMPRWRAGLLVGPSDRRPTSVRARPRGTGSSRVSTPFPGQRSSPGSSGQATACRRPFDWAEVGPAHPRTAYPPSTSSPRARGVQRSPEP